MSKTRRATRMAKRTPPADSRVRRRSAARRRGPSSQVTALEMLGKEESIREAVGFYKRVTKRPDVDAILKDLASL